MKFLCVFLFVLYCECTTDVSIDSDYRVSVKQSDENIVSTLEKLVVCSSSMHARKTIDTSVGCTTRGFVQFSLKGMRAVHPHPERVIDDHYYAQVVVKSYDKQTKLTSKELCVIRVPMKKKRDNSMIFFASAMLCLVICGVLMYITGRKRKKTKNDDVFKLTNDAVADQLEMYK